MLETMWGLVLASIREGISMISDFATWIGFVSSTIGFVSMLILNTINSASPRLLEVYL